MAVSKMEMFFDALRNTSRNTAKWVQNLDLSATATYDATGASLNLPAASSPGADADITSVNNYDLTGSYCQVQAVTVPNTATRADGIFSLQQETGVAPSNAVQFQFENNNLYAMKQVAGVQTNLHSATYSSTNHKWLRIRESGGTTCWETSTDGKTWNAFFSVANPITLTSLYVNFTALAWQAETNPGSFKVADVNFQRVGGFAPFL
jgi:hypothetical protein